MRKELIKKELEKIDKYILEIHKMWPSKKITLAPGHGRWLLELAKCLVELCPEDKIPIGAIDYAQMARRCWQIEK